MVFISSPANPRVNKLLDLHTTRGRKKSGLFLMEGPHLLEALLDAGMLPREVYYQPDLLQRTEEGKSLLARLLHVSAVPREGLVEVSERVIAALGEAQTSQGVISVLAMETFDPSILRARRAAVPRPALLILDDLADPGNMGTLLRTALAADVDEVLLTPHCVDCYSPKVVRAAAGAHVALPISANQGWQALVERVRMHCGGRPRVLLAEAGSGHLYYEQDLKAPFALIIGSEAHGPSQAARALATLTISIPLANGVESLNAAMAAGIVLYEGVRQSRSASPEPGDHGQHKR
ncbi:MAG: RNA methyltransferase [Ktedonobacteraceae bacterium]|nr:RNA methyltransferase [Ktedonobacteraceae bacterium]